MHKRVAEVVRQARVAQAQAMETRLRVRDDNARRWAQRKSGSVAQVSRPQ